jgi:hypothetical protein
LQIILSGIILCGLGVIAVYIAMIYAEIKRRPMYVINQQPASESQRGIKVM